MKIAKKKDLETGKPIYDKATVIYNDFITLKNIPLNPGLGCGIPLGS